MDSYTVKPRKTRDGYNLEGRRLSHGCLWYADESAAISYAKWLSRANGCKIQILNAKDEVIQTEEVAAEAFAY